MRAAFQFVDNAVRRQALEDTYAVLCCKKETLVDELAELDRLIYAVETAISGLRTEKPRLKVVRQPAYTGKGQGHGSDACQDRPIRG